jgi:hypothetical protein
MYQRDEPDWVSVWESRFMGEGGESILERRTTD